MSSYESNLALFSAGVSTSGGIRDAASGALMLGAAAAFAFAPIMLGGAVVAAVAAAGAPAIGAAMSVGASVAAVAAVAAGAGG